MPYIKAYLREDLDSNILPKDAGELNYRITTICDKYLSNEGMGYLTINEIIGALECAKLEFYRRIAAPYEDKKIKANGDVYKNV